MKLLAFGEVLWDIYGNEQLIGGASFNYAAHFSKCGGESYLVSSVGNDELLSETFNMLKKFNINSKYISVLSDKITGKCFVTLDENNIPNYNLLNIVAYDYIDTENVSDSFDLLYFGTLSLRNSYNVTSLKKLIDNNKFSEIFVDINLRKPYYTDETIFFCIKNATILKISDEELPDVTKSMDIKATETEEILREIYKKFNNLKNIILTKGEKGSLAFDCKQNNFYYAKAIKVKTVSTVGAGDSFSAAFSVKYLMGESIENCLEFASVLSSYVVSKKAAVPD